MDFEKPCCPIVDIDGAIACGKQFDLDINLPCDDRNVIYGVIRDCYKEPVKDAVVKLIEVVCECGKEERRPVSHTFTDEEGEFVFGPLCPDKKYEINFWVDQVKHIKVCAKCGHEGKCLKGVKTDKCDCFVGNCKSECKCECKEECKEKCEKECKDECKKECKDDYKPDWKPDFRPNCKPMCKPCDCKCDCDCKCKCDKKCERKCDCDCKCDCKNECCDCKNCR